MEKNYKNIKIKNNKLEKVWIILETKGYYLNAKRASKNTVEQDQ